MNAVNSIPRDESGEIDFSKISPEEVADCFLNSRRKIRMHRRQMRCTDTPLQKVSPEPQIHSLQEFQKRLHEYVHRRSTRLAQLAPSRPTFCPPEGLSQKVAGNITTSAGMVDANGDFHPRTCFTAGTKIRVLKKSVASKVKRPKDIPVTKEFEELANIEDVRVGDYVLSWNEKSKKTGYAKVLNTFVRKTDLIYTLKAGKDSLETTWNHPFWVMKADTDKISHSRYSASLVSAMQVSEPSDTKGHWVQAKDLRAGDTVLKSDGTLLKIGSIKSDKRTETVYNFEVAGNHTYFVGEEGVLVHNADYLERYENYRANLGFKTNKEVEDDIQKLKKERIDGKEKRERKRNFERAEQETAYERNVQDVAGYGAAKELEQSIINLTNKPPVFDTDEKRGEKLKSYDDKIEALKKTKNGQNDKSVDTEIKLKLSEKTNYMRMQDNLRDASLFFSIQESIANKAKLVSAEICYVNVNRIIGNLMEKKGTNLSDFYETKVKQASIITGKNKAPVFGDFTYSNEKLKFEEISGKPNEKQWETFLNSKTNYAVLWVDNNGDLKPNHHIIAARNESGEWINLDHNRTGGEWRGGKTSSVKEKIYNIRYYEKKEEKKK